MDFFYFSATLDTVSVLTATTTISLVLVVTFILYMVIKKCLKSRQALIRNYDMPEVVTMDGKYETLQRKKQSGEVGNNPAKLYGNSSYIFWVYQFELKVILFERYWHVCKKKIWNKMSVSFFFLPQSKNYLNELFTDAQSGRIHSSIKKEKTLLWK